MIDMRSVQLLERKVARLEAQMRRPSAIGARVRHNANQTIADITQTVVAFNTEVFDTGGFHDNTTDNSRLTAPADGYYLFGFSVTFAFHATGVRYARFLYNGGTVIGVSSVNAVTVTNQQTSIQASTLYYMTAGDYMTMDVYQSSGGNLALIGNSNSSPIFWVYKVG